MMSPYQGAFSFVRTTLDIDEDVLLAAREDAARERKSVGAVISALARESLRRRPQRVARCAAAPRGGRFAVLPQRDEVITLEHVRSLWEAEGA
jgi:hypothetical protein